jgi:hypothetical protein
MLPHFKIILWTLAMIGKIIMVNQLISSWNNKDLQKRISNLCKDFFLIEELVENQIEQIIEQSHSLSLMWNIDPRSAAILCLFIDYSFPGGKVTLPEICELIKIDSSKSDLVIPFLEELITKDFLTKSLSSYPFQFVFFLSERFEKIVDSIMC